MIDIQPLLLESAKGLGRLFLNPLFYWGIILLVVVGSKRVNRERKQFGFKVFPLFQENKYTWLSSLIVGIFISALFIGLEVVFPIPVLLLLTIVIILLSVHMKLTLLSASYTVGITYILILLSPFFLKYQSIYDVNLFTNSPLMHISLLIGILLMLEAFLLMNEHRNDTFPKLVKSERGLWIGQHHLKKLSIIPLLLFVPTEQLGSLGDLLPYVPVAGETYSLVLFPMLLGFDIPVRSQLAIEAGRKLGLFIGILGFVVSILAVGSFYFDWLSFIAVIIALIGREFIIFQFKIIEGRSQGYYTPKKEGLQVLSVLVNSPADRLGILNGEIITKVNGVPVETVDDFYKALQRSGANYRLDVLDDYGEIRIVQSAIFADEHYKLGLIFVDDPHFELGSRLKDFDQTNEI